MLQQSIEPAPTQAVIFDLFHRYGYASNALITKDKLELILKSEHKRILGKQISQELLQEIWQQTQANSRGQIAIETLVKVIIEAQQILRDRLMKLSGANGMINTTEQQITNKRQQLEDYKQYYSDQPTKINKLTTQLIQLQLLQKQQYHELDSFCIDHYSLCKIFAPQIQAYTTYRKQVTIYRGKNEVETKKSKQFLFVFHLTWVLIILDLFLANVRQPFLALCCYLASFYIIFIAVKPSQGSAQQNSYNKGGPIGYWIIATAVSIAFDTIFIILKLTNHFTLMPILHSSNDIYYWVLLFILGVTIAIRIILIVLYLRVRSQSEEYQQYFNIFGLRVYLFQEETNVQSNGIEQK